MGNFEPKTNLHNLPGNHLNGEQMYKEEETGIVKGKFYPVGVYSNLKNLNLKLFEDNKDTKKTAPAKKSVNPFYPPSLFCFYIMRIKCISMLLIPYCTENGNFVFEALRF